MKTQTICFTGHRKNTVRRVQKYRQTVASTNANDGSQ